MSHSLYRALLPIGFAALLALAIAPTQALANPDFLVDADWLVDRLHEESLIVLEARYHPHRFFAVGRAALQRRLVTLGQRADPAGRRRTRAL